LEDGYSGELKTEAEYKYNTNKKMLGDKTPEDFEEWAKYEFVNHPGSMKLLIVVDKLLTGFDAPAATYLYIDKEMRDHNLFQAICRVNRVNGEKKDYGYIVDYKHLFENIEGAIEDYTNGAFSGYDRTDIEGLLKSKIVEGKKDLDAALERCDRLSEPVKEPKGIDEFFDWFCYDQHKGTEEEHQAEIILNARKREDFYEACYTLVRCYTAIAMQMTEAGYTEEEADKIYLKVKTYDEIRNAISKRCGDYVDLKKFDAEMRALLDDYVVSSRVEVLENLEDFSFLGIIDIKDNGDVEVSDNAEIELGGRKGVAETMAANVRRVINRKRESNPEEYKLFSERINRLLEEYQQEKMEYKELLKSIKALAEELRKGENVDPRINTEGKKALYDNLGKDVDFALKVYDVIDANAAVGFRTSEIRKKKLLIAIQKTLVGTEFDAVKVLNIVIHNPEFGN
jgi:type I restriction enzyme R subunit